MTTKEFWRRYPAELLAIIVVHRWQSMARGTLREFEERPSSSGAR